MQYTVVLSSLWRLLLFHTMFFYCLYRERPHNPRKWITNAKLCFLTQSTSECLIYSLRGINSPLTVLPPHYFFFWNAHSQCQGLMSRQPRQAVAGYFALVENKEHSFLSIFWNLQVSKSMTISKTCNTDLRRYRRGETVPMNRTTSWFLYLTKWSYYRVLEIIH